VLEELKSEVLDKEIDGYIIIPENVIERRRIYYSARSLGNITEQMEISRAISTIVTNYRLIEKGFSPEEVQEEMAAGRIDLESVQITGHGEIEKSSESSQAVARGFIFAIYFILVIYGQMLMNSIIEDKSTRVSETVLSSVTSFELLAGKLLGICLLGFTQLVIYGTLIIAGIYFSESFLSASSQIMSIIEQVRFSPAVIIYLLIYFILGFIFYASIYGIVGAMVSTEDEGKQMQIPVTIFIVFAFFISLVSVENPETNQAYIASLIPFLTPILMIARIAAMDPILPDGTFLSIIILTVSIVIMIILSSRIFRVGILMYGKKASISEVIKWIRIK
jgi:ABC-2 type transport system permease protein